MTTLIDPKRVKLVLAPTLIFLGAVGIWKAGVSFAEFREELNRNFERLEAAIRDTRVELKQEIASKTADRWTKTEMKDWSYQLERANRDRTQPLSVPAIATATSRPD
jgi:hypothetical protein